MKKIVIFDVDGTIIDTEKASLVSFKNVLEEELGIIKKEEDLIHILGISSDATLDLFDFKDKKAAHKTWMKHIFENRKYDYIFDGMLETIHKLKENGYKLGVATSRNDYELYSEQLFEDIKDNFDCIVTANDTNKHKPDGEPLLKVLEKTGFKAEDAIYIGDTPYDKQCAANAGIDFYWAGWGITTDDINSDDKILKTPEDICKYL